MIPVTKSFIPPLSVYTGWVEKAFNNQWLTNRGALALSLEEKLKGYLDISFITLTTNGTLPLQIALQLLAKKGEVITTPFSYVASTSSIVWEGCTPVFVDIHPKYLTIDESKIEAAITSKTTAILATHVFGNPCAIDAIEAIAKKYKLAVIYDAAHAFGVTFQGTSIFNYGDVSTCSFHATKVFHTGEGGAMFTNTLEIHEKLYYRHNFGHKTQLDFYGLGINAKISELQAAMGHSVIEYVDDIFAARKSIVEQYDDLLDFDNLEKMTLRENTQWNYSYYPVIFKSEEQLLAVQDLLQSHNIFPRRYFYPSLNLLPYVTSISMPISESISKRILCLPLYHSLSATDVRKITSLINSCL